MTTPQFRVVARRDFFKAVGTVGTLAVLGGTAGAAGAAPRKGRLKQSVCRGVFGRLKLDLDGMCREAARLGSVGIDLVGPEAFPVLKKYGLVPTMVSGGSGIKNGINDKKYHAEIDAKMRSAVNAAADAGAPNVIVLAGDRQGISDEQGLENCVLFLNNIKKLAEDRGVTLCTELLNSKVNHPGYMCDHTRWGVELCKRVGSPRVKLLYDIYHMQIMEGDLISTITKTIQYIGHFHTGGVPGRGEIDESQEIFYPAVMRAIADSGYTGFVGQEFTPKRPDPLASLRQAVQICDV
jgi:hydroxypyruvate isomerase